MDVTGPEFDLPPSVDLVFNCIHETFGEDGQLQKGLERRGVPYTGARAAADAGAGGDFPEPLWRAI